MEKFEVGKKKGGVKKMEAYIKSESRDTIEFEFELEEKKYIIEFSKTDGSSRSFEIDIDGKLFYGSINFEEGDNLAEITILK